MLSNWLAERASDRDQHAVSETPPLVFVRAHCAGVARGEMIEITSLRLVTLPAHCLVARAACANSHWITDDGS